MPQLDPMIPFDTPKGEGFAFWRDGISQEHDTLYTVIITATREVWDFRQSEVRGVKNITMGRTSEPTPFRSTTRMDGCRVVRIAVWRNEAGRTINTDMDEATGRFPEPNLTDGPWTRL